MCVCTRCWTCSVYNNIIIVFFVLQYANWLHVVFYASVERDNSYTARSYHRLLQFRPFIPTTEKLFSPLRISFPRNTAGTASLCAIYPLKTRSSIQSPRVSSAIDAWSVAWRELWRTQCALTKKNIPARRQVNMSHRGFSTRETCFGRCAFWKNWAISVYNTV